MRGGFSFVTGIFMMVAVSILGVLILQFTALATVQKSQAFLYAQAELNARSATERAINEIRERIKNNEALQEHILKTDPNIEGFLTTYKYIILDKDTNTSFQITATSEYAPDNDEIQQTFPIRYTKTTVQIP